MIGIQRAPRPWSVGVHRRGRRYDVDVSIPTPAGRKHYRQKYVKKADADAQADAIRARLRAGLPPFETADERRPAVTVIEVADAYQPRTERGRQHIEAIRGTRLSKLSSEAFELADLEGFLAERGGLKTCAKDFAFLKRACRYAKAKGMIGRHYFEKLDGDKVTRRRLMPTYNPMKDSAGQEIPDAHLEAIFSKLSPAARRAVLFARTTGCRKREVDSLDWREHWTPEGFRPITQKGSRPRVVAFDPAILGARRPGGLVFSELGATAGEVYQRLTACWRYAVKAAKVPRYRFHDLRHTYGTILRREGRTFSDIAAIMGITEAMAHVYAREDTEALQIAAQGAAASATVKRLAANS